jgi:hypothetical protein
MTTSKHPPSGHTPTTLPADDLDCDPGIGESRGTTRAGGQTQQRERPGSIQGDNTVEGDVANDVDPAGGVNPNQRGRTNR